MRLMKHLEGHTILKVVEHIILRNYWEFYILETPPDYPENIKQAYVMGFENELGNVDINEIKPFIMSRTKKLTEVVPGAGFEWVDNESEN